MMIVSCSATMPQKHSVLCGVDRFTTQPVSLFRAARLLALFLRVARGSSLTFNLRLIAEHHVQQGTVNFNVAVVINKTHPEFVHKKTYARSRRADHLRKCLLADFSYNWLRPTFLAKIRQKQKDPCQPFLALIEQLIDQVLLDTTIASQEVRDKQLGKRWLFVDHASDVYLCYSHNHAFRHSGDGCHHFPWRS
jgi:hypothetical protein